MIFSPPTTEYSNFYDVARYNLTWKVCLFLAIFMPILGIVLSSLGEISVLPTFFSTAVALVLLLILKQSKTFTLSAIFFSVMGTILVQLIFILYVEVHHIVDTMWMLVIILFAFFTLGKVWGMIVSFLNLIGVIYFLFFVLRENLVSVKLLDNSDIIALSINFIIVFLLITYLINQFIITSKYSETKYVNLTSELEETNQEKTIMLKEIHHRVKNNLQVITSLLRLQSRDITHAESRVIFTESIDRVIAMSRIHEKIYQSESFSKIDLEEYIRSLSDNLIASYAVNQTIVTDIVSDIEYISTKSLVPISLIFNELISNSIKYAFIGNQTGKISMSVLNKNDEVEIIYKDNGTWKERKNPESFGLVLIEALTEQLNGTFTLSTDNGTVYSFVFSIDEKGTEF
jgi:two-component sensor histidine kinase